MFLHHDDLFDYWDVPVLLDVRLAVWAARIAERDEVRRSPSGGEALSVVLDLFQRLP